MFGTRNVSEASHSEFDLFAQHSVFWILDFGFSGSWAAQLVKRKEGGSRYFEQSQRSQGRVEGDGDQARHWQSQDQLADQESGEHGYLGT